MRVEYQSTNKAKLIRIYGDRAKMKLGKDWPSKGRLKRKHNDKNNGKDKEKNKESKNEFKNRKKEQGKGKYN